MAPVAIPEVKGSISSPTSGVLAFILIACLSSAVAGKEGPPPPVQPEHVTLNFINADIDGVAQAVGEITGKNFVIDPRVKGTVNIISAKQVPRAMVYEIFVTGLRMQGFAAVEDRGIVKIIPEAEAKLQTGVQTAKAALRTGDQIQTRVFNLVHESANQMIAVLRPLISPNNTISVAQNSNALVVTDYFSNLQRLAQIIGTLDQPTTSDPVLIPLFNASALDVAQTTERIFLEAGFGPTAIEPIQRFSIIADPRSNSVLVRAADPERFTRIRQMVALLDTPTSAAGNIHVVYLKNAEATKVAETLRAIFAGDTATNRNSSNAQTTSLSGMAPQTGQASMATAGIIQADAATNSIIITASDTVYNNLRAALEKLDVRRAQVYVEALIAEVTSDRAAEFGIQWQDLSAAGKSSAAVFGGTNFGTTSQNITSIAQNPASAGHGMNIGIVKGMVTLGGAQVLNLGLLVRALESDSNANILSTPTLLTLDNEEAKIVIGQNVPFITGQYAISAAATTPTPFQTIERKDVGLTLRIKPQISEGGAVRLQLFQEVSSVQDRTNVAGVITNKRSVESTVLVDDGQIIVIGGLMQDSVNDGLEKVPGLGDIPLVGGLFRYKTRSRNKTNLMVFLRPTVMRNAKGADALTSERYRFIRGEQFKSTPDHSAVLPDLEAPTLPMLASDSPVTTVTP